jgi:hypothetical protein
MVNVRTRFFVFSAAVLLTGVGPAATSHATVLTVTMLGNVQSSEVPEILADAPAKFVVTYDTGLAATIADPNGINIYSSPTSIWNIQMGAYVTNAVGGSLTVHNNFGGRDIFGGAVAVGAGPSFGTFNPGLPAGGLPLSAAQFGLIDHTATMFSTGNLPTAIFSGFDEAFLMLSFFLPGSGFNTDKQVRANIFSFSIEEAAAAPTPLPATLPLFATGLGVLGWAARRRKQRQRAA